LFNNPATTMLALECLHSCLVSTALGSIGQFARGGSAGCSRDVREVCVSDRGGFRCKLRQRNRVGEFSFTRTFKGHTMVKKEEAPAAPAKTPANDRAAAHRKGGRRRLFESPRAMSPRTGVSNANNA